MLNEEGCFNKTKPHGKRTGWKEIEYWEKIEETFPGKNKMLNLGYST